MSFDRFSSWASDSEPDQPEEVIDPAPEPVRSEPELSAESVLSALEALEPGESYEVELGARVFDEVYLQMKKTSPANRPAYRGGVLSFTKR
jgi:hypothetical protein